MPARNLKKRLNLAFRVATLLVICCLIVYLFPKTDSFQYEFEKGMPWRYETLYAPFDFPIYKTDSELAEEREKITREHPPIFNRNEQVKEQQVALFVSASKPLDERGHTAALQAVRTELERLYDRGILQFPEEYAAENIGTVKIVRNNFGEDVGIRQVYTLKEAYQTLIGFVGRLNQPEEWKEQLSDLDLNNFLHPNLEFDDTKTKLQLANQLRNISLTQGLVHNGELVIAQRELVTPEKIKLLNSLRKEFQHNAGSALDSLRLTGGQIILTLASLLVFSLFFYFSKKRIFYNNKNFIFLYGSFLGTVLLGSAGYYYNIDMLALPVLFFVIIVNTLTGSRPALYLLLGSSLLISYFAPNSYVYLFMQIAGGIVAIFSLAQMQRRGQMFLSLFFIFLMYAAVYTAMTLIRDGDIGLTFLLGIVWLLVNCLLLSLAYPVIYLFEKLFGFTSDITLMELSNPNHPALRALTQKAPGTFQHSLMVANLAEEAIYRIGGSPLLTRTGALYHDIGKSVEPILFIENQTGGINPHDQFDFDESARHIIGHVTKGVELAKKHNLPEAVINFIRTHHGKSKVKYFYNSFQNKYPDREVDESLFTYIGPDPVSKEASVLMMADAVEAASRTLKEKTEENISKLVSDIIDGQVSEGRYQNAELTFRDVATVKQVFTEMLVNIYHSRIVYPKLNHTEKPEETSGNPTE
ncbi:MAG: HDIG domain-containing protein [Culturomica sp.]|jgi:putative nucleotidyltransferase with HDIG domain|nr:HDIG domain-containing protein [Culturomica sp.]